MMIKLQTKIDKNIINTVKVIKNHRKKENKKGELISIHSYDDNQAQASD